MKLKLRYLSDSVIPRFYYAANDSIIGLKISSDVKYTTLFVNINTPINFIPFIFYDGSTADLNDYTRASSRRQSAELDALGAQFMYFIELQDSYWLSGACASIGWTDGSPYDYITHKEIPYLVQSLCEQGLTASSTDKYVYVNWHEDSREFVLYGGYTGPDGLVAASEHTKLVRTMGQLFNGGTGYDGISFYGLKHYFPGVAWGMYNAPRWTYYFGNDVGQYANIWNVSPEQTTQFINHAADVFISDPELVDSIDMLMPSVYSVINSPELNRVHSEQATRLCTAINTKLKAQNKKPKLIIPFITPLYLTSHTLRPYEITIGDSSAPATKYIPPYSFMTNDDMSYETIEPIIENEADGMIIWLSSSYREKQILGRDPKQSEDVPLGEEASWRMGPTAGITNPWSMKSVSRQAISAYENYTRGVCMGITGSRWWWATEVSGATFTPAEWLPLSTNKTAPAAGATSGITAQAMVERILEDSKKRAINVFKTVWDAS